ncbi:MAG: peptidylprolyl isomerase [Burkholderiaceae bacterium]|jgi:peptidyl-prolyl cis-trans isomerase SurA|nr:peptidylprolyl isomerase [Burkholderiaceae bacterium]
MTNPPRSFSVLPPRRARLAAGLLAVCLAAAGVGAAWPGLARAQQNPQAKTASQHQPAARKKAPAGKKPAKPAAQAASAAVSAPAPAALAPAALAPVPAPTASAPAARVGAGPADHIVAVVNTEPVTNSEVRERVARAQRDARARNLPEPVTGELRKAALEYLIAERAQLQYARQQGLKVSDEALAQAELAVARQNGLSSAEELERRVQAEGIALKAFRDDMRKQVLLAQLREREIEPKIQVSNAEVDSFIREQTGAPASEPLLNLAMILVAVPEHAAPGETERLQARAQEVARRAKTGEDFAKLAAEYSDANRRGADGGVLGLRPADQYPELFVQSVRGLRVGEVVGPIQSGAGYHVLKVLERKQNDQLAEVKIPQTQARHILLKIGPAQSESVARQRLADFKRRILSGQATFGDLARENSQDAGSAEDGGELGWASPGQFVPEFEQAMNNLDPGQISDPIPTRYGIHLIQVEGRRAKVLTPDEQRQLARNMLREKKAQEAFDTWAKEVRGGAYIEYRDPPD